MEILFYYFIMALSFSIMYTIRYAYEIVWAVKTHLTILDIDYREYDWSPGFFLFFSWLLSFIGMPIALSGIFSTNRTKMILETTSDILEKDFGLPKIK